jgi:hypothetical protein
MTRSRVSVRGAGFCRTDVNGWIRINLEGTPFEIGYGHGFLLANEIVEAVRLSKAYAENVYKRPWTFFRETADELYLPKMPEDQKYEMKGILSGMRKRGIQKIDLIDIVAINGLLDTFSYHYWLSDHGKAQKGPGGHCSAFIATGGATKNGEIVIAHNTWLGYILSSTYNVMVSIKPSKGNEILFQSWPGSIQGSGIDWYINSRGLMVTNTTIGGIFTFKEEGIPYFVRARKAIQEAKSIDQWLNVMLKDNNGGDASDWLVGDARTGEIMWFELGTDHHAIKRTFDGAFVSCNLSLDSKVRTETNVDYQETSTSSASRYARWEQLMKQYKGRINVEYAKQFLADHFDCSLDRDFPSRGTLCGHVEVDQRGWPEWECGPNYPAGAVDGKTTDSFLTLQGKTWARWGKPCGIDFISTDFLNNHSEYCWMRPYLRDLISYPWTLFSIYPRWSKKRRTHY